MIASALAGLVVVVALALHPRTITRRPVPATATTDDRLPDWPEVLDAAARGVRAGDSLTMALRAALHSHGQGGALRADVPIPTLLDRRARDPDERFVLDTLATAAALDGAVAPLLHAAAGTLRERAALAAEVATHAAAARLSARVLTVVPVGAAALGMLTSGAARAATTSGAGLTCIALGLLLNEAGRRWMRRIVREAGG